MIAYNHYIKFIPEMKNDEKLEGTYTNEIMVQENTNFNMENKIDYKLTFFNNQERDLSLYTDRIFACTVQGQFWAFEVKGVVTFFWHSGDLTLEYVKNEGFTNELFKYWLLHIALPIFFTIEETLDFLHAGAVEIEGKPILFLAESFGGKSTITDFFMKKGHQMISDDKVGIYEKNGQFFAVPSHPHHRPYRNIEDLGYEVKNFSLSPKPIHAIYELEKAEKDTEIKINELRGIEKFKSLRYASEMNLFFLKTKRFLFLTSMAKPIPVYKIKVPWNIERLTEVYDHLVKHSKNIKEKIV